MSTEQKLAAVEESYRRLAVAARELIASANYPAADGDEARIYRSQLVALERELTGEPQASGMWMSP